MKRGRAGLNLVKEEKCLPLLDRFSGVYAKLPAEPLRIDSAFKKGVDIQVALEIDFNEMVERFSKPADRVGFPNLAGAPY